MDVAANILQNTKLSEDAPATVQHHTEKKADSTPSQAPTQPITSDDPHSALAPSGNAPNKEQVVTPWDVEGAVDEEGKAQAIDYTTLIEKFGTTPISPHILERFEKLTGRKPHIFLRRGVFFSHRWVAFVVAERTVTH